MFQNNYIIFTLKFLLATKFFVIIHICQLWIFVFVDISFILILKPIFYAGAKISIRSNKMTRLIISLD